MLAPARRRRRPVPAVRCNRPSGIGRRHIVLPRCETSSRRRGDMGDMSLASRSPGDHSMPEVASPTRALVLATISFTLSFAAWGLVGGLASVFTGLYRLSASQTALLVAVPVLLGSLARLPMGMLTDRFGGRLVFTRSSRFSVAGRLRRPVDQQLQLLLVAASWSASPDRRSRSARLSCRAGRPPRARAPRSACTAWARSASRWPSSAAR